MTNKAKLLLSIAVCVGLFGCKEMAKVDVKGDAYTPTFHVSDTSAVLQSLEVLRYCLDNEKIGFRLKWMISRQNGEKKIRDIKYGEVPPGFAEEVVSSPLQINEIYRVEIAGLRTDYTGLFVIQERSGQRQIEEVNLIDGMTFEDWLKSKRGFFEVLCDGTQAETSRGIR
jgi:hypothetical protein